ncbi:MAG: hypothetical protein ABIT38_22440 [Gemmatimonadaceae bacterium]
MLAHLAVGGVIAGNRWLGIHAPEDISGSYREGLRAPPTATFERSSPARHIYTGSLTTDGITARFAKLQLTSSDSMYDGAFVRAAADAELLALEGGGWLTVHQTKPHRAGTYVVSRVEAEGRIIWQIDTGIAQLNDVLPNASWPAFVGTRPRVPGMVSEPILVIVDARNGHLTTRSRWMND